MREKELNKKLAELAEFEDIVLTEFNLEAITPDGWAIMFPFTKSLDVCFKWLVPVALGILAKKGYCPPIMKLFQLWYDELVSLTGNSSDVYQAALALCKAIEKLIDGEAK